jgi:hypothetical protein
MRGALAAAALALGAGGFRGGEEGAEVLYLFLAPSGAESGEAARRAGEFLRERGGRARLRVVLLVQDFEKLGRVGIGDPLEGVFRELGPLEISLYDEEGLALAEAWEVRAVPAFVWVAGGKAHRVYGARVKLSEALRCGR